VIYTCEAGKWVRFDTRILSAEKEKGVRAIKAKGKSKTAKFLGGVFFYPLFCFLLTTRLHRFPQEKTNYFNDTD